MNLVTVTLGQLVDATLEELQSDSEVGRTVVRPAALADNETQFTLNNPTNVNVSDRLEFGSELMLVVVKSADPDPLFTVTRGYYNTVAQAHPAQQAGVQNPNQARKRVARAVQRAMPRLEAMGVILLKSSVMTVTTGADSRSYVALPEDVREVWAVRDGFTRSNRWDFVDDGPGGSKALVLRRSTQATDTPTVVYKAPYRWSTFPVEPDESATLQIPEGAENLPASYAAAWLISAREVSRMQLDRAEEWSAGEPARGGVSAGLVRAKWQEFYRALDEVRRLDAPIPRRPYVPLHA